MILKKFICSSKNKLYFTSVIMREYASLIVPTDRNSESSGSRSSDVTRYEDIIKPELDKRLYRGLCLENGLKIFLINDEDTDKSAASLTVGAGSMNDPKDLPGLAHFLEHMLFLGSKKYPRENDYQKFVSEHGGMTNAYTSDCETNYYFDITPEHLTGALDRFAQFFIDPLFTESAVDREVNAVNSEHEKNIPVDAWRINQVHKSTCSPNHDYNNFGTGNIMTLDKVPKEKGVVVRDRLIEFHSNVYSANIMCLAILGKENLDELEKLVTETFSSVKDNNLKPSVYNESPLREKDLKKKLYVLPIKDIRKLKMIFPVPDMIKFYKSAPDYYVSHLLGHEGVGSLFSLLREEGLVDSLSAGTSRLATGISEFQINMNLTVDAMSRIDDIITFVFQYIQLLKTDGIHEWIYEENRILEKLTFRFKDKESPRSYVTKVASGLHEYPFKDVLYAPYALEEWKPDLIKQLLDDLNPDNMRVILVGQQFEDKVDQTEKWYGAKYGLEDIPDDKLNVWRNPGLCEKLKLPPPNEFVPRNTDLYTQEENNPKFPCIIHESSISRIWFKQDDEFLLPKNNVVLEVFSPVAFLSPKHSCMLALFVSLFKDSLNEYAYLADLADLKWSINPVKYGFILNVSGYNEKLPVLLKKIFDKLSNFKVEEKRFNIYKENIIRSLKNFEKEQPHQHAQFYLSLLLTDCAWSNAEKLEACVLIQIEDVRKFVRDLLYQIYIQALVHGNCDKTHASEIIDIIEGPFRSQPGLLPQQLLASRELQLNDGCNFSFSVDHKYHSNSCVNIYYQCGLESTVNNVVTELFAQIISEPCFDTLRTQEQLGYIVGSGVRPRNGVQGFIVLVQSEKHPLYVDDRIEEFLINFNTSLKEMTDEQFELHKKSLAAKRLEKPKQLNVLTARFFSEISSRFYNFDRANIEVAGLETVTKPDIIKFYEELINKDSKTRRKLAVHICSDVTKPTTADAQEKKGEEITDIIKFKMSHSLCPLPKSFINVPPIGTKSKL